MCKSVAAMTTFWLAVGKVGRGGPSWLIADVIALARGWALVKLMVATRSIPSVALHRCSSVSWALSAARSSARSTWHWAVHSSASICRVWIHGCYAPW
jgi:hypothetical protein